MATYVSISLNVTNANDSSAIVGAQVFINGTINFDPTQFTVVTDANGNAQFQIPSNLGNQVMQITASGFTSTSQLVNTATLSPQYIAVTMTPSLPQSAIVSFQFVPAQAGIVWQILQGVTTVASGVSVSDGSSATVSPIAFGAYTVNATLAGYQAFTQQITVGGQTSPYVLTLIATVNPATAQQGNTNGSSVPITTSPSSILSQTTTVPPVSSEYIYPNSDYEKYFTITGARMYVGNLFVDELNSVQWALQDNAIPVYGYSSRYVDAYAQGRSLVQGQLTLNFVTEGYLYTVLQQYKQFIAANLTNNPTIGTPAAQSVTQVLGLMASRDSLLQQANSNPNGSTTATQQGIVNALNTQINGMLNAMTPAQIDSVNAQRNQAANTFTGAVSFDNAVYQDVIFDIRVEMGNEVTGVKRVRYLEKCKLISNEMVIAPDGQTLLDSYGFIARRLR